MFKKKRHLSSVTYKFVAVFALAILLGFSLGHRSSYVPTTNCCRQMAEDIEDKLESRGIDVKIMRGETEDGNSSHAWVSIFGIEFDSVSLIPYLFNEMNIFRFNHTTYNDYSGLQDYWAASAGKPLD